MPCRRWITPNNQNWFSNLAVCQTIRTPDFPPSNSVSPVKLDRLQLLSTFGVLLNQLLVKTPYSKCVGRYEHITIYSLTADKWDTALRWSIAVLGVSPMSKCWTRREVPAVRSKCRLPAPHPTHECGGHRDKFCKKVRNDVNFWRCWIEVWIYFYSSDLAP